MAGALDLATPLLSIAFTVTNKTAPAGKLAFFESAQTAPEQADTGTADLSATCAEPCIYPQVKLATQFFVTVVVHFGK